MALAIVFQIIVRGKKQIQPAGTESDGTEPRCPSFTLASLATSIAPALLGMPFEHGVQLCGLVVADSVFYQLAQFITSTAAPTVINGFLHKKTWQVVIIDTAIVSLSQRTAASLQATLFMILLPSWIFTASEIILASTLSAVFSSLQKEHKMSISRSEVINTQRLNLAKADNKTLQTKVSSLSATNETLSADFANISNEKTSLADNNADLINSNSELTAKSLDLANQIKTLENGKGILVFQKDIVSKENANLISVNGALMDKIKADENGRADLIMEISGLKSENDSATSAVSVLSDQNTQLSDQNTQLSDQNTQVSDQNTKLTAQNTKLEEELTKSTKHANDLAQTVKRNQNEIDKVRQQHKALQESHTSLTAELDVANKRVIECEAKAIKAQKDVTAIEELHNSAQEKISCLLKKQSELEKSAIDAQSNQERLKGDLAAVQNAKVAVDALLAKEKSSHANIVCTLQGDLQQAQANLKAAEAARAEFDAELATEKSSRAEFATKCETIQGDLKTVIADLLNAQNVASDLNAQITESQATHTKYISTTNGKLAQQTDEISSLKEKNKALEDANANATAPHKKIASELDKQDTAFTALQVANKDLIAQLEKKNVISAGEHQKQKTANDALQVANEDMVAALGQKDTSIFNLQEEVTALSAASKDIFGIRGKEHKFAIDAALKAKDNDIRAKDNKIAELEHTLAKANKALLRPKPCRKWSATDTEDDPIDTKSRVSSPPAKNPLGATHMALTKSEVAHTPRGVLLEPDGLLPHLKTLSLEPGTDSAVPDGGSRPLSAILTDDSLGTGASRSSSKDVSSPSLPTHTGSSSHSGNTQASASTTNSSPRSFEDSVSQPQECIGISEKQDVSQISSASLCISQESADLPSSPPTPTPKPIKGTTSGHTGNGREVAVSEEVEPYIIVLSSDANKADLSKPPEHKALLPPEPDSQPAPVQAISQAFDIKIADFLSRPDASNDMSASRYATADFVPRSREQQDDDISKMKESEEIVAATRARKPNRRPQANRRNDTSSAGLSDIMTHPATPSTAGGSIEHGLPRSSTHSGTMISTSSASSGIPTGPRSDRLAQHAGKTPRQSTGLQQSSESTPHSEVPLSLRPGGLLWSWQQGKSASNAVTQLVQTPQVMSPVLAPTPTPQPHSISSPPSTLPPGPANAPELVENKSIRDSARASGGPLAERTDKTPPISSKPVTESKSVDIKSVQASAWATGGRYAQRAVAAPVAPSTPNVNSTPQSAHGTMSTPRSVNPVRTNSVVDTRMAARSTVPSRVVDSKSTLTSRWGNGGDLAQKAATPSNSAIRKQQQQQQPPRGPRQSRFELPPSLAPGGLLSGHISSSLHAASTGNGPLQSAPAAVPSAQVANAPKPDNASISRSAAATTPPVSIPRHTSQVGPSSAPTTGTSSHDPDSELEDEDSDADNNQGESSSQSAQPRRRRKTRRAGAGNPVKRYGKDENGNWLVVRGREGPCKKRLAADDTGEMDVNEDAAVEKNKEEEEDEAEAEGKGKGRATNASS